MSRRWFLAALIGLGLAGWIAWILVSRGTEATRPAPSEPAAADSPAWPAPSPAIPRTSAAAFPTTAIHPKPVDETESASSPSAPTAGKTLTVLLAPEMTPASGANVDFNGFNTDADIRANWKKLDASKTVELVADANGVVRLPGFKLYAMVRGRSGGRNGETLLFAGPKPATLLLQAAIGVLVTSASGIAQPDVPVAIVDRDHPRSALKRGVTGGDGMAALVPPQTPMQAETGRAPKLSVALALPLPDPVEKLVDPMDPPAASIQLVLPPCGRVIVRLKRADGTPFLDAATVGICPARDQQPPVLQSAALDELRVRADGGAASFPLVPLGGNLIVRAVPHTPGLGRSETTAPGPRSTGADTIVELTCGSLATLVTGRVVDPSGNPVTKAVVDATIQSEGAEALSLMFQPLDGEGRFNLRFEVDPATITAKEIQLGVRRTPAPGGLMSLRQPETLTKALPAGIGSGSVDIGDVVFRGADVAGGVVVDQDGKAGGIEGSIKGLGGRSWDRRSGDALFTIVLAGKNAWIRALIRSGEKDYVLSVSDGVFEAHDLLPGTYSIRFVGKDGKELLAVNDVVVTAGEINRDPRLQDVDVSAFLSSRTVTVVDEADKPIENAEVAATEEGSNRFTTVKTDSDGRAVVTSRGKTAEVVVAREGYRAVKLPRVTGDVRATLEKSAPKPVTIRLDDSFTTPPKVEISVTLIWLCGPDEGRPEKATRGDPRTEYQSGRFGADRTVRAQVQNPGIYEVELWWSSGGLSDAGGGPFGQKGAKATLTVPEDGPTPTVTVIPDDAALKRALDERKNGKE